MTHRAENFDDIFEANVFIKKNCYAENFIGNGTGITGLVPYTGATADLNLGNHNFYLQTIGGSGVSFFSNGQFNVTDNEVSKKYIGFNLGTLQLGDFDNGFGNSASMQYLNDNLYLSNFNGDIWLYTDSNILIPSLSMNGFVKTSNSDGTLIVDTTSYLDTTTAGTTYAKLDGTNTPFTGGISFRGSVSETATGTSRLDIGVQLGTPRQIFEQAGYAPWQVDSYNGTFRWFQPGIVFFYIQPNATPSNGAYSAFGGTYPVAFDTATGLATFSRDLNISRNLDVNGKGQIGYAGTTNQRSYAILDLNTSSSKGLSMMDSVNGGLLLGYTGATIQGRTTANGNTQDLQLQPFGGNISFVYSSGTKIGTATTQKIGFWNATPVTQPATNAYTSDGEGTAYTGIDNAQAGTPYAQLTDLNQLRVAYETLRASYDDLLSKLKTTGIIS